MRFLLRPANLKVSAGFLALVSGVQSGALRVLAISFISAYADNFLWAGSVVTEAQDDGLRKDFGLVGDFKPKVGFSV
jgi:hypothetical protein